MADIPQPLSVSVSASSILVDPNQDVVLIWAIVGIHKIPQDTIVLSVDGNGTPIPGSGNLVSYSSPVYGYAYNVFPAVTTTYTITATRASDGAVASASVTVTVRPPVVSISASPNPCPYGSTEVLIYSSSGATTLSIDNGIGVVSGPNGTVNISNFTAATRFIITATGPTGITASAYVDVVLLIPPPPSSLIVTPITAPFDQAFNSSYNYPPDTYTVTYLDGAMRYNNALNQWFRPTVTITDHAGNDVAWAASIAYATSSSCIAGEVGATKTYVHVGGPISITFVDSFYGDNDETTPGPTYGLTGAPVVPFSPIFGTFIASSPTIYAGQSTNLVLASTNATAASIDHSIGSVAVNSTTSVSPTVSTTYAVTLTAPNCADVIYTVTVTVLPIPAPINVTATSECEGILIAWDVVSIATSYNLLRSTVQGGPYTSIWTGAETSKFDDSTLGGHPVPWLQNYYVVRAVLSSSSSGNSLEVTTNATAIPAVPTITVEPAAGSLVIEGSPVAHAASYNIYASMVAADPSPPTIITGLTSPNYVLSPFDGTPTMYITMTAVNACGESSKSVEVIGTPLDLDVWKTNPITEFQSSYNESGIASTTWEQDGDAGSQFPSPNTGPKTSWS